MRILIIWLTFLWCAVGALAQSSATPTYDTATGQGASNQSPASVQAEPNPVVDLESRMDKRFEDTWKRQDDRLKEVESQIWQRYEKEVLHWDSMVQQSTDNAKWFAGYAVPFLSALVGLMALLVVILTWYYGSTIRDLSEQAEKQSTELKVLDDKSTEVRRVLETIEARANEVKNDLEAIDRRAKDVKEVLDSTDLRAEESKRDLDAIETRAAEVKKNLDASEALLCDISKQSDIAKTDVSAMQEALNSIYENMIEIQQDIHEKSNSFQTQFQMMTVRSTDDVNQLAVLPGHKQPMDVIAGAAFVQGVTSEAISAERRKQWTKALSLWKTVLAYDSDNIRAVQGAAFSLSSLAEREKRQDKYRTFWKDACNMWREAIRLDQSRATFHYNLGVGLFQSAKTEKNQERKRTLYLQACESWEKTIEISSDYIDAYRGGTEALMLLSRLEDNQQEKQTLFKRAEKLSVELNSVASGLGNYNLACIAALQNDTEGCHEWIKKSEEQGVLPDAIHLRSDEDLASVRDKEWFKNLLMRLEEPKDTDEEASP